MNFPAYRNIDALSESADPIKPVSQAYFPLTPLSCDRAILVALDELEHRASQF
jgi:hypothetical protein